MALNDHGQYSGVVDIARNGIDEVIRLQTQAKQAADALESQSREIAALKEQEAELCTLHGLAEAECKRLRKDAELWRWAITIGENQAMNFLDAYDDWDGQDSFEDAAIAAKGGA